MRKYRHAPIMIDALYDQ